jgi:Na+/phosphate symporter
MTISIFAVVLAVVGAFIFALSSNPKASELGRIMFFCGLFALCLIMGGKTVHIP